VKYRLATPPKIVHDPFGVATARLKDTALQHWQRSCFVFRFKQYQASCKSRSAGCRKM